MGIASLILLDTHVLVWTVITPDRLSKVAAAAIERGKRGSGVGVSAITLWELARLFSSGQIRYPGTIENSIRDFIQSAGAVVLPITLEIAALASQFSEDYPRDPADRIIGGTARAEGIPLVTKDERIREYRLIKTIW